MNIPLIVYYMTNPAIGVKEILAQIAFHSAKAVVVVARWVVQVVLRC